MAGRAHLSLSNSPPPQSGSHELLLLTRLLPPDCSLCMAGCSTKHEPVTPDVFSAWVGAVEVSLQAVAGRCEQSKQQADRLAAELGVSLAAALGAAGKGAAAEAHEAANRLAAVQGQRHTYRGRAEAGTQPELPLASLACAGACT